jgi:photosystem II stability/assembly factor-like uncharacterized protein
MLQTPKAPSAPDQPLVDDVEAGVIEDARARQRRHRVGIAGVLAAAAIGVLLLSFSGGRGGQGGTTYSRAGNSRPAAASSISARPVESTPTATPGSISQIGLLAPGVGWAASTEGLYLTRDGGRSWRRLELPGLGADATAAISNDASASWSSLLLTYSASLEFGQCENPTNPSMVLTATGVALTRDTGRRWQTYSLPGCPDVYSLNFANARFGTMAEAPQYSTRTRELYTTQDGGQRWHRVAPIPFFGQLVFGSARNGLGLAWQSPAISGADATPVRVSLLRTGDGGHSWHTTTICGYPAHTAITVICQRPILFGDRIGYVSAVATNHDTHQHALLVYATTDGGKTWVTRRLPPLPRRLQADLGNYVAVPFSAPDSRHLYTLVGAKLFASANGGRSWTRFAVPKLATAGPLDFVSARYGWTMTGQHLYATTDGGRDWQQI